MSSPTNTVLLDLEDSSAAWAISRSASPDEWITVHLDSWSYCYVLTRHFIVKPDFNARAFSDAETVLEFLEEQCRNNEVYLGILKTKFVQKLGHWRLYPVSDCYCN